MTEQGGNTPKISRREEPLELSLERGRVSEQRFKDVIISSIERKIAPERIKGLRQSTSKEDKKGIDWWIDTDIGPIQVQVKSSKKGAQVGRKKSREENIERIVLSVNPKESNEELLAKVIIAVDEIRQERLKQTEQKE